MNLYRKQKQAYRKLTWLPKGTGNKGGINQEYEINRYKLLHIKQVNNKHLLHSSVNYTQYLIITHNEK